MLRPFRPRSTTAVDTRMPLPRATSLDLHDRGTQIASLRFATRQCPRGTGWMLASVSQGRCQKHWRAGKLLADRLLCKTRLLLASTWVGRPSGVPRLVWCKVESNKTETSICSVHWNSELLENRVYWVRPACT